MEPMDDDTALSALLDGALPAEEARRVRERLAADPRLALRLEELRGVDAALREAYTGIVHEPLPQRTVALLRPRRARWQRIALPASLAVAAGFLLAVLVLPRTESSLLEGLLAEGGAVAGGSSMYEVLQAAPSSESRSILRGVTATPRLSFRDRAGDPCRVLAVRDAGSGIEILACRRGAQWRAELIAPHAQATGPADGAYRPAAGTPSRIDAAIDGVPFGAQAERELISRGWRD